VTGIIEFIERYAGTFTVVATIAIAIFTWVLAHVTGRLARLTKDVAEASRDAANAAKKSADVAERALVTLEGPVLYIVDVKEQLFPRGAHAVYPGGEDAPFPQLDLFFFNVGRSSAFIKETRYQIMIAEQDPDDPQFTAIDCNDRPGHTVVGVNVKTLAFPCVYPHRLNNEIIDAIKSNTMHVYAFGSIRYDGILGPRNIYKFLLRSFIAPNGKCEFATCGKADWNAHHTEKVDAGLSHSP